jgi:hypothetical protein
MIFHGKRFQMEHLIAEMQQALPPVFLGSKIGELTGYSICWGTVQNRRSRGEIPNESEIFIRAGNRMLVSRDAFLRWWVTTLSPVERVPVEPPRRGRRHNRVSARPATE